MNVFIRVDSSTQIGTGHLVRCRTLARELLRRGATVSFVCRDHPGHQAQLLKDDGFAVRMLPAPDSPRDSSDWLGTSQQRDASDTIEAVAGEALDCLIVDHYALGRQWENQLRRDAAQIVVIDDLADRQHDCDILIDQNFFAEPSTRYANLVSPRAKLLLGPTYAIIDRSYLALKPRVRSTIKRVLLFFGGVDKDNATSLALEALSREGLATVQLDVVVGSANPHRKFIEAQVARRGNAALHYQLPNLADVMWGADLAVGAGGSTNWERLYSGLPAIVVSVAPNQSHVSEELTQAGLVDFVGTFKSISSTDLASRVFGFFNNPARLKDMSERGPFLVDGLGAARLAELIAPTEQASLRLRPAVASDAIVYFGWANEAEVRQNSLSSDAISMEDHMAWFSERIASDQSRLFVFETPDGLPIGQIRFDRRSDCRYRLSYSLDPVVRGRGLARSLVMLGMRQLAQLGEIEVVAEVKESNTASISVFEKLGFERERTDPSLCRYKAWTASTTKGMH